MNLVKIDVEGHEDRVLAGMERTILRFHPAIIVECVAEGPYAKVDSMLRSFGYTVYLLTDRGRVPVDRIVPDRRFGNYLAVRTA